MKKETQESLQTYTVLTPLEIREKHIQTRDGTLHLLDWQGSWATETALHH